jgi:hypothetical protein
LKTAKEDVSVVFSVKYLDKKAYVCYNYSTPQNREENSDDIQKELNQSSEKSHFGLSFWYHGTLWNISVIYQ